MRRRLFGVAVALAAVVLVPALRLALIARGELAAGVAAAGAGDPRAAQVHFERAARCGFPLNAYADEALRRLAALSEAWRGERQALHALSAAESVRGAVLSTGQAFRHAALLEEATGRVVRLRRELSGIWPAGAAGGGPAAESDVRLTLVRRGAPRPVPAIAGVLCLWAAAALLLPALGEWSAPRRGWPGLRWYLAACLAISAALTILSRA